MSLSTNIAVLFKYYQYLYCMYLSFFVIIYNFTKGRNISRPRCAPLPRTVSKFWKRKRKLLSCVPVLDKT